MNNNKEGNEEMEQDYKEEALQNAEDEAVGYAEFVSSWVAGGGSSGDASQAWGEYWAAPADAEEWKQEAGGAATLPLDGAF